MGAKVACANHLEAVAELYCPQCDKHLCPQCTRHFWAGTGFVDQCLACQAVLRRLDDNRMVAGSRKPMNADVPAGGAAAFVERLPQILGYPIKPSVLLTLGGLALITAPLSWALGSGAGMIGSVLIPYRIGQAHYGLLGWMIVVGLEISIYFHMVMRTAHGQEDLQAPDFDNIFDDLLAPIGRYVVAFSPILAGMLVYGKLQHDEALMGFVLLFKPTLVLDQPIAAALFFGGIALLPLLTAIAAMSGSALSVLNPKLWAESLRVMAPTYPVAAVCFYGVLAFEYLWYSPFLMQDLRPELDIPLLGSWLVFALSYLPLALRARILGAMCQPYLGDFD